MKTPLQGLKLERRRYPNTAKWNGYRANASAHCAQPNPSNQFGCFCGGEIMWRSSMHPEPESAISGVER